MPSRLERRRNLVGVTEERWRPPLHRTPGTNLDRSFAALRRIFDLQAASIWRDLASELPRAQGIVVDVGCGAQPYRPLLGDGARYLGIDTVEAARPISRARPGPSGTNPQTSFSAPRRSSTY